MNVIITRSQMSQDFEFNAVNRSFAKMDGSQHIRVGTNIRYRIMGINESTNRITVTGTIIEQYLGVMD